MKIQITNGYVNLESLVERRVDSVELRKDDELGERELMLYVQTEKRVRTWAHARRLMEVWQLLGRPVRVVKYFWWYEVKAGECLHDVWSYSDKEVWCGRCRCKIKTKPGRKAMWVDFGLWIGKLTCRHYWVMGSTVRGPNYVNLGLGKGGRIVGKEMNTCVVCRKRVAGPE